MTEEEKKAIKYLDFLSNEKCECDACQYSKKQYKIILNLIDNQQKEIEKYKRYFKLAVSDLQSEGYMQMPYKDIEEYYSKREDIV